MNFTRTLALKLMAVLVIIVLLNILSSLSVQPSHWWTSGIVITIAIVIIVMVVILIGGEVHEIKDKDNDLLD